MAALATGPVILVSDGWLGNTGDAASYQATTASLRRAMPGARVAVAAHHRELVGDRYPDLDLVPPLDVVAGVSWPWTTAADVEERNVVERVLDEADLVLAAGGGYLLERYGPEPRIRIYEEVLERGKRLMFYAQSIGRFREAELRGRLVAVLEAAALILVRDEPSLAIVDEYRGAENVHLTADEAFLFPSVRRLARPRTLLATVSLHPWDRREGENELDDESHLPEIAAALTRLLESEAVRTVTLASTAQGLGGPAALEDDAVAARAVYQRIPANWRNRVVLTSGYLTPREYAELAAHHTALVTMRMHGAILAATAGVPVLMLNASDKARALSARTGGGIKAIEAREDLARMDELVLPILTDPGATLIGQNAALEQMRNLARKNAMLVAGALA
ncbi:MAG: polysaccharide pyruvyl transferase family protein [Solirubrobacterales bacterium]